jgi:hypothetical protein
MRIVRYSSDLQANWDDFVRTKSRNGTIFHEQQFLSYHGSRFEDCSIMVVEDKSTNILAVLPAALIKEVNNYGIVSHPGSTYGGIIFREDLKFRQLKDVVDAVLRYYHLNFGPCYFKMILQEEFRSVTSFCDLIYLLWHRGFRLYVKEIGMCKDLGEQSFEKYRGTTRQYVMSGKDSKLGIKHSRVSETEKMKTCYHLLANNLKRRYAKGPTHSLEELLNLKKLLGDRVMFFSSTYENEIIATVIVFELNKEVVHDFYIAQDYAFARMNPLVGLFHYIFDYYRSLNFEFFNFGISSRDKWIKWGILEFKEQFGGKAVTRDTWILPDIFGEWPYDGAPV